MTSMTTRPNDVLTTIEPDNEADCTQRFLRRDPRTREYMLRVLPTALRVFVPVFNTHLPLHLWYFVIISSPNMPGKAAEPVYPPKMPDFEKSLGAQAPTADNMPSKVELKKPSSDDADSSEVAEDKPEKEKEGGIKDYFASVNQSICAELDWLIDSEFSNTRTALTSSCTPSHSQAVLRLALLYLWWHWCSAHQQLPSAILRPVRATRSSSLPRSIISSSTSCICSLPASSSATWQHFAYVLRLPEPHAPWGRRFWRVCWGRKYGISTKKAMNLQRRRLRWVRDHPLHGIRSLTEALRRQSCQSRYCREIVYTRSKHLTFLLEIYCDTRCSVKACSHYHKHSASHCSDDSRMSQLWCTLEDLNCK